MSRSLLAISSMVLLFLRMADPAHSVIYSWRDTTGVVNFSNDPGRVPRDAQVVVGSTPSSSQRQTVSALPVTESTREPVVDQSSSIATEGEFVVQLAAELGLGSNLALNQAARLLTDLRIAPPLGEWQLDIAMTPELTIRLRALTVAAADMGWITITPEQALLAFDTTSALLAVPIPIAPSEEVAEPAYPIVEVPPLVYVYPPPPAVYTYYTWVPVTGGFWWHDIRFHGFFALDHDLHRFNGHPFTFEPHMIRRHFVDHHVVNTHVATHTRVAAAMIHPPAPPVRLHRQVRPQVNSHVSLPGPSGAHGRQHIATRRLPVQSVDIRHRSPAPPPARMRPAVGTPARSHSIHRQSSLSLLQKPTASQAPPSHSAWSTNRHRATHAPSRFLSGTRSTSSTSHRSSRGGHGKSVSHGGGIGH